MQLISTRSVLYQTALELYDRHQPTQHDSCRCQRLECDVADFMAEVIAAASPVWFGWNGYTLQIWTHPYRGVVDAYAAGILAWP